jgi:phenylalanyl-tRNA synthetase beta chain
MPLRDLHRLLGISVSLDRAAESLSLLGFDVTAEEESLSVQVPFWRRVDVERSADEVEEVARMIGYEAIPSTLMSRTMPPFEPLPGLYWEGVVRGRLLAAGVNEATTHSLTSPDAMLRLLGPGSDGREPDGSHEPPKLWERIVVNPAGVFKREALTVPLHLRNPATLDRQTLRLSLLPGLLDVVARNLKETEERVAFFEIDRTYFPRNAGLPYERRTLALALAGSRRPVSWQEPAPADYSFYDLKGALTTVLQSLHVEGWEVQAKAHASLHPGRSAVLRFCGHDVARLGELHPEVAAAFEIEGRRVQVAEVDLDSLFAAATDQRVFRPLPRHPAAHRDIAVVVQQGVPAGEILRLVREVGDDLLESARIFDVYVGDPLPEGSKSIAVSLDFRAPGTTLTHEEVDELVQRIVGALTRELRATLRE